MIYLVENFSVPDFGGFCWEENSKDHVPRLCRGVIALAASPAWDEICVLHQAVHSLQKEPPRLLAECSAMSFKDGRETALGQVFIPGHFFERKTNGLHEYRPLDEWEIKSNMDGDCYWGKVDLRNGRPDFYAPIATACAALTRDLVDQIWTDWYRFPPRQQTLMQHFAAMCQMRGL